MKDGLEELIREALVELAELRHALENVQFYGLTAAFDGLAKEDLKEAVEHFEHLATSSFTDALIEQLLDAAWLELKAE